MADFDLNIDIDFKRGRTPRAFARKLRQFDDALDEELEAAMQDAVLMVEADAKRRAPVDTGNLRASIASLVESNVTDRVKGYVGSNVEYAPFPGVRHALHESAAVPPAGDRSEPPADHRPIRAGGG